MLPIAGVVFALLSRASLRRLVKSSAIKKAVNEKRLYYVLRSIDGLFIIGCFIVFLTYAGLDVDDLGVFLGSIIAVLGVSLFAQWSILSNATASILIFFFFPYRVGDSITILDSENSVHGTIKEIALFHVILSSENGSTITFPTSLIFQKAVTVNAKHGSEV
ncbi:mechanosensitive ion channel [Reinekea thalattae]|uniref:Small-conductance mechanosensitive channel n=2 Tax=Reinekea thalattae TaxID=2593301 RepID=A0A5C8Z1W2_9GAMM|nr:mechanosensitive ion channel [Reinekea thalattae]